MKTNMNTVPKSKHLNLSEFKALLSEARSLARCQMSTATIKVRRNRSNLNAWRARRESNPEPPDP